MSPNQGCPNPDCPNRGMLTLDANTVFFLVEGAIRRCQVSHPALTNAGRLPCILEELDRYLETIKRCCSLDGTLHISDQVFGEVSLNDRREIVRMGLKELIKYNSSERRQILQVLRRHFPQPPVASEHEIRALRELCLNPDVRLHDRDASLMVVAFHLAGNGESVVVVTSDPDFVKPIRWLVRQGVVTLEEGYAIPTERILNRHYFNFLRRLHDCCNLGTDVYNTLAETYFNAQVERATRLRRDDVFQRVMGELQEIWKVHSVSLQYKDATTNIAKA